MVAEAMLRIWQWLVDQRLEKLSFECTSSLSEQYKPEFTSKHSLQLHTASKVAVIQDRGLRVSFPRNHFQFFTALTVGKILPAMLHIVYSLLQSRLVPSSPGHRDCDRILFRDPVSASTLSSFL